ncbi:MAG: hypothetical protein A2X94_17280 [Bdellovibrionales bacterium GWB1_55_8]|nr:MAG: hypothetical protein A2X94_17280 [Bdellovibrionales bacterium GWB1_55_8]
MRDILKSSRMHPRIVLARPGETFVGTSELILAITKLLGGLALFIFSMTLMSREIQQAAEQKLRGLLYRLTTNRASGAVAGTTAGFLIHSGATMLMLVSFINAGLMTFPQSISVMIGANLGTTFAMQVVSLHIERYSYLFIFFGLAAHLALKRPSFKHIGMFIFGFGVLFLGMGAMSEAVGPLKNSGYFEFLAQKADGATVLGMLTGVLISTLFTTAIQSSGGTIGILFALSSANVFTSFDHVFPLILGAHIGTCSTALLGSFGTQINARRAAIAHLSFNVIGMILALLMYRFYAQVIPAISTDLPRQIANTHTLVQFVNGLIFIALGPQFAKFIVWISPSKLKERENSYLEDRLLDTPEKAIMASLMELKRMSSIAREMFQMAMRGFLDVDQKKFQYVSKSEEALDALKDAIGAYLLTIAERDLSRRQSIIIQYLLTATSDLERIGDHVESMSEITREKVQRKVWFEEHEMQDLIELYKKTDAILALIVRSFEPSFYDSPSQLAARILEMRAEYVSMSQKIKEKQCNMILEKKENALNGIFYHRLVVCFDKLVKHSKTIALVEKEPFFFLKKHKLEKKTERIATSGSQNQPIAYDSKIFEE